MDIETIKKNPIKLQSYFSTALTYIVIGLLLSTFTFNIGYLSYLQSIASAVCYFLGLRLIKNLETSFKWAYYISIYFLIILTLLNILQMVSPIIQSVDYAYINLFINIVRMILISVGLNKYISSHQNISFISLYLFAQVVVIFFQSDNVDILVFIIFSIILFLPIRSLWKCRQEIKEKHDDITVKVPKVQSSIFIGGWIALTIVLSMGLPYIWPYFAYDYVEPIEEETYQKVVDESTHFETFDKVTVYETNDNYYRIVAEYQEENVQRKYSFMNIQYNIIKSPRGYISYLPNYISISDEKGTLKSHDTVLEQPFGFFESEADVMPQKVYLNPSSKNIKITIVFTINKADLIPNEDEEENILNSYVSNSINIHRYKYGSFSDNAESVFDNFTIDKDGKLNRNEENGID